ncbi:tetratricopeptide repeat protein 12 [Phlebotomus papatasi]|uniref:tetratricopeptide repeat protein 12 n=1 Tax=Phlebotomus papatasi TaxID=29031 RepID=UPI0024843B59|nr:tetratricopeptide repeat protein 12 [Phlebotomus papatasi]
MAKAKEDEEFGAFESKVDEVMNILKFMSSDDIQDQQVGISMADRYLGNDKKHLDSVNIDNFIVKVKEDRTVINNTTNEETSAIAQDKHAFMASMEKDAGRRYAERKERESLAQNLRKLGNAAFRKEEYEKAISMYSKAIDQVRDSPILYNNRALCYMRVGLYKRAIIDCDFVINKLDEKNLRSWLYRAKSYYHLGETRNYEKSISEAKKNNPKDLPFIEDVVKDIEANQQIED